MSISESFDVGGVSGDGGRDVGMMCSRRVLRAEGRPYSLSMSLMCGAAPARAFSLLALLAPSTAEDEFKPFTQDVGWVSGKQLVDAGDG